MSLLWPARFVQRTYRCQNLLKGIRSNGHNIIPIASTSSPVIWDKNYSTIYAQKQKIDPLLNRLDDDVKRFGRISRKDFKMLFEEIKNKHITSLQSLLIIRCCGNLLPEEFPAERTKLVNEIWDMFLNKNIPMDISHYNALLRVYIENDYNFSVENFLKTLNEKQLEPNRVTFQRLMWHYCQNGDVESASLILEQMKERKLPLSETVLDALVLGHVRQNNIEGAYSVLNALNGAGLSPTSHTYKIIMCGYAKQGNMDKVKEIIEDCEKNEIYFSDKELMEILEEFSVAGYSEFVNYMLSIMKKNAGYNQEAINLIYRLINRNCENFAYEVLKSMTKSQHQMSDDVPLYQSAFYIRHLINSNSPIETIISQCKLLKNEGLSPKALHIATEVALVKKSEELAFSLFEALRNEGEPLRQHFFWPLFMANNNKNVEGCFNVIRRMIEDFQINPNIETLRDHVIPYVIGADSIKCIQILWENGVPLTFAVKSVFQYIIHMNNLQEALKVASIYGTRTNLKHVTIGLVHSFHNTKDVETFAKVVNYICSDEIRVNQSLAENREETNEDNIYENQRELTGQLLDFMVVSAKSYNILDYFPDILQRFFDLGMGITEEWANKIKYRIGKNISTEISDLLLKLVSDDIKLTLQEISSPPPPRRNPQQLETLIVNLENKGENVVSLKKRLLYYHIRSKEIEKTEQYLNQLQNEEFVQSYGLKCLLMDLYAFNGNLEKALEYRDEILNINSDAGVDLIKILRLANLLIKEDQFEKALEVLEMKINDNIEEGYLKNSLSRQILEQLAEKGDVEKVQLVFNLLKEKKYFEISNSLLGPLVKVHLVNDNINTAIETFEDCCHRYRCTPMKNEINKKLILSENINDLQKITDLSTIIHGEVNSLYDLVFGFIECGHIKQARKILETPGMRIRIHRFNSIIERYSLKEKVDILEKTLEATRNLNHIDRSLLIEHLLNSYIKEDNVEKALSLWTLLQEEDILPSNTFLINLSQILKLHNMSVPFIIPTISENMPIKSEIELYNENIEQLITNGDFKKVTDIVIEDLATEKKTNERLVKYLINSLSKEGCSNLLESLGSILSDKDKIKYSYDNKRCSSYKDDDSIMEYLNELENKIDTLIPENSFDIETQFPLGGIHSLLGNEKYTERVINIIEKYAEKGIIQPMNSLWIYQLITDNEKASEIWNKYLRNHSKVLFRKVITTAVTSNNAELVEKLITYLKSNPHINNKTLGYVYSIYIDILIKQQKYEGANILFKNALNDGIPEMDFHIETLNRLKRIPERVDNTGFLS